MRDAQVQNDQRHETLCAHQDAKDSWLSPRELAEESSGQTLANSFADNRRKCAQNDVAPHGAWVQEAEMSVQANDREEQRQEHDGHQVFNTLHQLVL